RVEQPPADEVTDVRDDRDIRVDHRVIDPVDGDLRTDVEAVALSGDGGLDAVLGQDADGRLVGVHGGLRVAGDQPADPVHVDVVGVLMGDEDGGEPGQRLESG